LPSQLAGCHNGRNFLVTPIASIRKGLEQLAFESSNPIESLTNQPLKIEPAASPNLSQGTCDFALL